MSAGPQIDTITALPAGTTSITVGSSNPRQCLVFWAQDQGDQNGPVPPTITYNGTAVTWPVSPAQEFFLNLRSPYMGYILNPATGTHNVVNSNSTPAACVLYYDVNQATPFGSSANGNTGASSTNAVATPWNAPAITTSVANSVIIKSFNSNNASGNTWSNGVGETFTFYRSDIGTNAPPNGSSTNTTSVGTYTLQTNWIGSGGNTAHIASQAIELLWGGAITASASDSIMNAASRSVTVTRSNQLRRSLSDSISVGAGRLITQGKALFGNVSVSIMNGAGRLASVGDVVKVSWHTIVKSITSWL